MVSDLMRNTKVDELGGSLSSFARLPLVAVTNRLLLVSEMMLVV